MKQFKKLAFWIRSTRMDISSNFYCRHNYLPPQKGREYTLHLDWCHCHFRWYGIYLLFVHIFVNSCILAAIIFIIIYYIKCNVAYIYIYTHTAIF